MLAKHRSHTHTFDAPDTDSPDNSLVNDDYLWLNLANEIGNHDCFYYFLSLINDQHWI